MRAIITVVARRYGQLAFMAAVTTCLLAFVFTQAGRGVAGLPGAVVYAFAAGFGLEFVSSAWTGRWARRGSSRQLQS